MSQLETTTKALIVANGKRIIEILESGVFEKKYGTYTGPDKSELTKKMAELRRDTMRLEKILYGRLRTCPQCNNEFTANNSCQGNCWDCYLKSKKKELTTNADS